MSKPYEVTNLALAMPEMVCSVVTREQEQTKQHEHEASVQPVPHTASPRPHVVSFVLQGDA